MIRLVPLVTINVYRQTRSSVSKVSNCAIHNQPHIKRYFRSEQLGYAMLILEPTDQLIKFGQHMALVSLAPGYGLLLKICVSTSRASSL